MQAAAKADVKRRDVILVASVSCIYGLGNPEAYQGMALPLSVGDSVGREDLLGAAWPGVVVGDDALTQAIESYVSVHATPLTEAREPDLSYVVNSAHAIAGQLRPGQLIAQPVTGQQTHMGAGIWNRDNVLLGLYGQWQDAPQKPPKNSRVAATTGRILIKPSGLACSGSRMLMRSRTTRSKRSKPMRK